VLRVRLQLAGGKIRLKIGRQAAEGPQGLLISLLANRLAADEHGPGANPAQQLEPTVADCAFRSLVSDRHEQ